MSKNIRISNNDNDKILNKNENMRISGIKFGRLSKRISIKGEIQDYNNLNEKNNNEQDNNIIEKNNNEQNNNIIEKKSIIQKDNNEPDFIINGKKVSLSNIKPIHLTNSLNKSNVSITSNPKNSLKTNISNNSKGLLNEKFSLKSDISDITNKSYIKKSLNKDIKDSLKENMKKAIKQFKTERKNIVKDAFENDDIEDLKFRWKKFAKRYSNIEIPEINEKNFEQKKKEFIEVFKEKMGESNAKFYNKIFIMIVSTGQFLGQMLGLQYMDGYAECMIKCITEHRRILIEFGMENVGDNPDEKSQYSPLTRLCGFIFLETIVFIGLRFLIGMKKEQAIQTTTDIGRKGPDIINVVSDATEKSNGDLGGTFGNILGSLLGNEDDSDDEEEEKKEKTKLSEIPEQEIKGPKISRNKVKSQDNLKENK